MKLMAWILKLNAKELRKMLGGGSLPVGHLATLPFKVSLAKSKGTAQVKISIDRSIPMEQVKGSSLSGTRPYLADDATSEILGSRSSGGGLCSRGRCWLWNTLWSSDWICEFDFWAGMRQVGHWLADEYWIAFKCRINVRPEERPGRLFCPCAPSACRFVSKTHAHWYFVIFLIFTFPPSLLCCIMHDFLFRFYSNLPSSCFLLRFISFLFFQLFALHGDRRLKSHFFKKKKQFFLLICLPSSPTGGTRVPTKSPRRDLGLTRD